MKTKEKMNLRMVKRKPLWRKRSSQGGSFASKE